MGKLLPSTDARLLWQMPEHGRPGIGAGNRSVEDVPKHGPRRFVGPACG
jgi:hypothetical protein